MTEIVAAPEPEKSDVEEERDELDWAVLSVIGLERKLEELVSGMDRKKVEYEIQKLYQKGSSETRAIPFAEGFLLLSFALTRIRL